ncbi:AP-4-A phosphorylase [bacterium HR14]|nr:AP-4-A phosphorylase [bacterium HR14]
MLLTETVSGTLFLMRERLWAPWRLQYVSNAGKTAGEGCIFCTKPAEQQDAENLILWRSTYCFALLNLYPYTSGHTMVAPYRHTADIADLTPDESLDLWQLMQKCVRAIQQVYKPDGFNIGFNLGRAAGAGIEGHLHLHIVPRWHGDTNFMTTIGEVRVLPESLEQTYARLKTALEEAMRDGRTD